MGTNELQITKTHTLLMTRHHQPDLYTHKETNILSPSTDIEECPSIEILTGGGAGSKGVGGGEQEQARARAPDACLSPCSTTSTRHHGQTDSRRCD